MFNQKQYHQNLTQLNTRHKTAVCLSDEETITG